MLTVAMGGLALMLCSPLAAQAGEASRDTDRPRLGLVHGITSRGCLVRPDGWLSITAVVENPGPSEESAVLSAWPTSSSNERTEPGEGVSFQRQLSLTPRSQRAVPLLIHIGKPTEHLEVRLTVQGETSSRARLKLFNSLDSEAKRQRSPRQILPALLISQGADQSLIPALLRSAAPMTLGPRTPHIHEARITGLPHHPLGYHPFDLVVLDQVSPHRLGGPKLKALAGWVAAGGHLLMVFSGTPGAWRDTPLNALLPLRVERTLPLSPGLPLLNLPDPKRLLTSDRSAHPQAITVKETSAGLGTMHPEAAAWWRAKPTAESPLGEPLLLSRPYGGGTVSMLTFSPSRSSSTNASNNRGLSHLISRIGSQSEGPDALLGDLAREFTVQIPEVRPPPVLGIGAVLLLYALLVGPVSWLVLRSWGRREWTLATGPALAIAFCIALNQVSLCYRGSDPLRTRFTIVNARVAAPGDDAAPGRIVEHTGYFVPRKGRYSGSTRHDASEQPAFPAAVNLAHRRSSQLGARATARVDESDGSFSLDDLLVEASTGRLLSVHDQLTSSPISCQLQLAPASTTQSARLLGHIQAGPYDLPNSALVVGERFFALPKLTAGQRVDHSSPLDAWQPERIPAPIYNHLRRFAPTTDPMLSPWQEASPLSTTLALLLAPRTSRPGHLPATFVCQLAPREPLTSLLFQPPGRSRASAGLALVTAEIPLPRGNRVQIPPGLLTSRLAASAEESRDIFTPSRQRLIELSEETSAIYEYTLPLIPGLGDTVAQLELRCSVENLQLPLRVDAFDFGSRRFRTMLTRAASSPGIQLSKVIPSSLAPKLVHPTLGVVWIRISALAPTSASFLAQPLAIERLELGVTGRRR